MATNKHFNLLFFLVIASIGHATSHTNSSPFAFIKKLEGCQKGNITKGIHDLKIYLNRFGYIQNLNETDNDVFDDILESAIKTYQENYNIIPMGTMDADTVSKMTEDGRCGVPDIVNGFNTMQPRKNSSIDNTLPHFYNFAAKQKTWPANKRRLRYQFIGNFPDVAKIPVQSAFKRWSSVTKFTFLEDSSAHQADLTIGFFSRDHGDGFPFDGPRGKIAHAFYPPDGRFHFDIDEKWFYLFKTNNAYDLWTTALHEIGHLLGLYHTKVNGAIMYPYIRRGEIRDLQPDDIQHYRALYGDS